MATTCPAIDAPNTLWNFCPSMGAAVAFLIFFSLAFAAHVAQGIYYRKSYTWVVGMSALWQILTYVFRIISIQNPASLGDYAAWFVLILVAPLWTNAFVYMVFGRMVWNYMPNSSLFGIRASRFGIYFVILDIVAFIVQVWGASSTQGQHDNTSQILAGIHIYMGGVALQQFFIFVFCYFAFVFWRTVSEQKNKGIPPSGDLSSQSGIVLLYALVGVLLLITIRILFRLAEYSNGLQSTIPSHEAFQYCLDSLPMLLAFVVLSVFHPGSIMKGPSCDIPSRKERKANGINCKSDISESRGIRMTLNERQEEAV